MHLARRGAGFLAIQALVLPLVYAGAAVFPWKSEFSKGSAPDLKELHEAIYTAHTADLRAVPVSGQAWSEEDFTLTLESGTLFLEPPIQGVTVGAFFEGKATVSFTPRTAAARSSLELHLNRPGLVKLPITTVYLFSLRPDSLFATLKPAQADAAPTAPGRPEVYQADKSAMRQLGLDLTWSFLNRDGPARGATYALFPMEEIRTSRSEEARLLYTFNPMLGLGLSVFGHEEMVDIKPYKFRFYPLVSYAPRLGAHGFCDVDRFAVKISLGTAAKSASEEAVLTYRPAPGLHALRLGLTTQMQVTAVTDAGGRSRPFLQWEHLENDPNFDESLLVSLEDGAGAGTEGVTSLAVSSHGLLFEPWFSSFVLMDEDNWYPHPDAGFVRGDAHYELDLTIPKKYAGIGIGEKVLDEEAGPSKRIVYRTTQPIDDSTFYYGDYLTTAGTADEIKVELFQHRTDVGERQNAKFTMTEVTNTLKVFNRMSVPLDIKNLRGSSVSGSRTAVSPSLPGATPPRRRAGAGWSGSRRSSRRRSTSLRSPSTSTFRETSSRCVPGSSTANRAR
jgi:hypothetical protein